MSDAKPASPYVPQTEEKRPSWATMLGVACGIGVLAFAAAAVGAIGSLVWLTTAGFVLFCAAGVVAAAGGYTYFLYERSE